MSLNRNESLEMVSAHVDEIKKWADENGYPSPGSYAFALGVLSAVLADYIWRIGKSNGEEFAVKIFEQVKFLGGK